MFQTISAAYPQQIAANRPILESILAKFEDLQNSYPNRLGADVYTINFGTARDNALARQICQMLNHLIRCRTAEDFRAKVCTDTMIGAAEYQRSHFLAEAPLDLIVPHFFTVPSGKLMLATRIDRKEVIAAISEALDHPERRHDLLQHLRDTTEALV